jgi:putative transposase
MGNVENLGHTRWDCKYHLVWVPKCRWKVLYGQLRKYLGKVLHDLAGQKESKILEGHLQADHVHMLVSIPPPYSVSQVVGFIKGKSAIHIARSYLGRRKNYTGMHFWARGYFVSTVAADEATIRDYIQKQEKKDARLDQLGLFPEE